eukprot:TRINITY_DN18986_c0_g1_i1.p1 TRINITY_DN18986_c0_g1~~TRINITY_DN18986_c0_g1_i1.p1  ORF type:complete len:490 (-),score=139.35 TRINITY_DN18986_c0_g1_i1:1715-3184(-)
MKGKKRPAAAPGREDKHATSLVQEMDEEFMSERSMKHRPEKARKRQEQEEYVRAGTSGKILRVARQQQQEVENELDEERGIAATRRAFSAAEEAVLRQGKGQPVVDSDDEDEEGDDADERGTEDGEDEKGYSDTESQYNDMVLEEVTEEDERAMAHFLAAEAAPQRTLADIIMSKIKEKETEAGVAPAEDPDGARTVPGVDARVMEVYRGVGKLLRRYSAGKVPKAFKIVPSLSNWEEILYLTEPECWSPNAMYAATRLFASNLNARMAQRFYSLVLLPRIRNDIREKKRLHFALYQSVKKALYKPSAFYKGFLLPLCQTRTCNLREAFIIGSVLQKVSIPVLHSSVALLKIAEMQYAGTNSYFMKLLLDKKYALPYRVIDALVAHFMRFLDEEPGVPVIWHQCLLTFIQRYKHELAEESQQALMRLMRHQRHHLVTPEIQRELQHSRVRGQEEQDPRWPANRSQVAVVQGLLEDYQSLPHVSIGMDED